MVEPIDPRIEAYAERMSSPHETLLAELSEQTTREVGMEQMLTGPLAGRFLELLVWISRPQRVLEIGTFTGHSALSMAAALPDGGRIDACEIDPERAAFAQRLVRPLAARREDHVARRPRRRDDRFARAATSISSSSTPTRRAMSTTTRRCFRGLRTTA